MDQKSEIIKSIAVELLEKMGFGDGTEVRLVQEDGVTKIDIVSSEPQFLIGTQGANLLYLKHVLKLIVRKRVEEEQPASPSLGGPILIEVDVNGYREQKIALLKDLAHELAERVVSSGKPLFLKPMPSFDRRIIHVELALREDVVTESVGEEPERRLMIKPAFQP